MKKKVLVSILCMSLSLGCSTPNKKPLSTGDKRLPPSIRNAEVKTLWIPDKIESDRYEEGHYLYIIEKPATWRTE